ncbi:MAG: hypothetical protein K1X74_20370 [Pirellulales bacterium]|nr:hypothetical protein [Pirellulales bacterium]
MRCDTRAAGSSSLGFIGRRTDSWQRVRHARRPLFLLGHSSRNRLHLKDELMQSKLKYLLSCGVLLSLAFLATPAHAAIMTLIDHNALVEVDPTSQSGLSTWTVDGIDHMYQQWFWYRQGNVAEKSIDTLPLVTSNVFDPEFDGSDNGFFARYQQPGVNGFRLDLLYTLLGGDNGSGTADLAEQIRIRNTGETTLNLTFFQYCDFDLSSVPAGDTGASFNANSVTQSNGVVVVAETVVTPVPARREVNLFSNTLTALNDGVATNLNNNAAALDGDVTWAFQWDITLPVGGTFIISKDKHIQTILVPEPSSALLAGLGLMGLVPLTRRMRRKAG